nr:hypothetical protein B11C_140026 [Bartonella sp. 1-1C]
MKLCENDQWESTIEGRKISSDTVLMTISANFCACSLFCPLARAEEIASLRA